MPVARHDATKWLVEGWLGGGTGLPSRRVLTILSLAALGAAATAFVLLGTARAARPPAVLGGAVTSMGAGRPRAGRHGGDAGADVAVSLHAVGRPTVSVIVPALDEAHGIARMLAAVHGAFEIIVADGGSRDDTARLAAELGAQVVPAPRGRALQMNAGARRARGDVLLFLHADTRLPHDGIAQVADAIADGARWGRFDVALRPARAALAVVAAAMNLRSRLTGICTGDQAMFVQRSLWSEVGGFAPIPLMEDIELSARLRRIAPCRSLRDRVQTSSRRWLAQGVVRTVVSMWSLRAAYFLGASPWRLHGRYYRVAPPAARGTVIVFAKAPMAGRVKTRLAAQVGQQVALQAYEALARCAIEAVAGVPDAVRELRYDGDPRHPKLRSWAGQADARLLPQGEGDLGVRMRRALAEATRGGLPAVLIGSDCPEVDAALITHALDALTGAGSSGEGVGARAGARAGEPAGVRAGAVAGVADAADGSGAAQANAPVVDAVFAPAGDGGYALVGVCRDLPELFEGIAWSSPQVMAQTRARCREAGVRWLELRTVHDVDDAAGLARWRGAA